MIAKKQKNLGACPREQEVVFCESTASRVPELCLYSSVRQALVQ